jgi:hypothetical protein
MNKVDELCPWCEEEVELDAKMEMQTCPNCSMKWTQSQGQQFHISRCSLVKI